MLLTNTLSINNLSTNEIYHIFPLIAVIGYVYYPQNLRINCLLVQMMSIIYNFLLVLFSGWTFISLSQILYQDGIIFEKTYYFSIPQFNKIMFYFYLSKYIEFIDTFILYLNDKKPIFLHKYHHIGAVICWHLLYVYKVDCIWIPTFVNSFVHTIMYSYYLGCLLKMNQIRFIKQYITTLQLIQLTIPVVLSLYFYYPPVENIFNYFLIKVFVGYVVILVVLFSQFYYKEYIKKIKNS